jgi:hypothetical protein
MVFPLRLVSNAFLDPFALTSGHAFEARPDRGQIDFRPIGLTVRADDACAVLLFPSVKHCLTFMRECGAAPILHGDQFAPDERRGKPAPAVPHVEKCMRVGKPIGLKTPAALFLLPWARAFTIGRDEALAVGG